MNRPLIEAFLAIPGTPSPDAVVADPELNRLFLQNCSSLGLSEPPESLNRSLLNARKCGDLEGLRKSKKRTIKNQEEFRFASEIAARLEPRNKTEPVLSGTTEPLGPLVVGDGSRRAQAAQLDTRVSARSESRPGVVA
jgi:hypothetical protein